MSLLLPLPLAKATLLSLSALGFYLTWYLFLHNGAVDLMHRVRDRPDHPVTLPHHTHPEALLKETYTGIGFVDYQLTVLTLFFYNIVDGSHPGACVQAFHFGGQMVAGWGVLVAEGLRGGNRGRAFSFVTLWGLLMQNVDFAIVMPVYCFVHLATSPTVSSRRQEDFLIDPVTLSAIPISIALGLVLPSVLMALPAPAVVSYERKQVFVAVWQAFPLWVGVLQAAIPRLRRKLWGGDAGVGTPPSQHVIISSMRTVYATLLAIAVLTRVSALTISFCAVLFPSLFAPEAQGALTPSAVFVPRGVTAAAKMPSIAAGAAQFLVYDEMVGGVAMVVWVGVLYVSELRRKDVWHWPALIAEGTAVGAVAGWGGFAVAALWARDGIVFADEEEGGIADKKKNS